LTHNALDLSSFSRTDFLILNVIAYLGDEGIDETTIDANSGIRIICLLKMIKSAMKTIF